MMKNGAWAAAGLLLPLLLGHPAVAQQPRAERVILISCDGLRPDAIDAAGATVMQALIAAGSYQPTALDEFPSVTLPNHASMVTGLSVASHGILANGVLPGRIASTTIFDVARSAGLRIGCFIGKSKLGFLCPEAEADVWRHTGDVSELAEAAAAAIADDDLQLVFIHFREPDGAGHADGWMSEPYLAAVREVDAAIGVVLDAVDAAGIRDETAIIITADHGGHFTAHGFDIPDDRLIPFIIQGPGIAAGRVLCEQVRVMDAAATALDMLGLSTESATDARIVTEAFAEVEQIPCGPTPPIVGLACLVPPVLASGLIAVALIRRRRSDGTVRIKAPGR